MDTLYCDVCFASIIRNPRLTFFCGKDATCSKHIHCQMCVTAFCRVCKKKMEKVQINSKLTTDAFKKFIPLDHLTTSIQTSVKRNIETYSAFEDHGIKKEKVFDKYSGGQRKLDKQRETTSKINKAHHAVEERTVKLKKYIKDLWIYYRYKLSKIQKKPFYQRKPSKMQRGPQKNSSNQRFFRTTSR